MSQHDHAAAEETEDRFYAQFDSREVKLMTLDELVSAFEAGEVHENTFVCREGDDQWETLAVVAGLSNSDESAEEEEQAQATREPAAERRPPMSNRMPEGALLASTRPPMSNRAPEGALLASTRPPMSNRPGTDTMPPARQVSAYPAIVASSPALSFAPVTSNIDLSSLDLDELAFRPKRKTGKIVGIVAALGIVGGAAAFIGTGGLHSFAGPSSDNAASAAQLSPASLPTPEAKPVAPTPEPAAAPTPSAAADSAAPAATPAGFSDDMKAALLAADKEHESHHAAKMSGHARASGGHRASAKKAGSGGFKSGGSAYDPLNGKL